MISCNTLSVTPSVILSGAKNNLSFSSEAKNLDCFLRSRSFAKWSCGQRNEAKPPQAGSVLGLLNVCTALVTFITYPILCTFKCYLMQAACHNLFGDPAARCHTLRSRFCSITLRSLMLRNIHFAKLRLIRAVRSFAQDDTRGECHGLEYAYPPQPSFVLFFIPNLLTKTINNDIIHLLNYFM